MERNTLYMLTSIRTKKLVSHECTKVKNLFELLLNIILRIDQLNITYII